jgi:hypothetical protein
MGAAPCEMGRGDLLGRGAARRPYSHVQSGGRSSRVAAQHLVRALGAIEVLERYRERTRRRLPAVKERAPAVVLGAGLAFRRGEQRLLRFPFLLRGDGNVVLALLDGVDRSAVRIRRHVLEDR